MKTTVLTVAYTLLLTTTGIAETVKHRILTADSSKQRIAIVSESGDVEWEMQIGPLHDLHQLQNGNLLFQLNWTTVVEVRPEDRSIVWKYDATQRPENAGKKIEIHSFQRLKSGNTMIAESGSSRIVEVDQDGQIVHTVALQVRKPHPHRDTRLVRQLDNGHYLVCHEGEGTVREYARQGEVVWEFAVPLFGRQPAPGHGPEAFGNQCFSALRLENGHTLISTGNGHSVIEVTPQKQIVWKLEQNDLPDIQLAWVTTLQKLPNGNLVIGNCHAGVENPQIVEVTRDKKVVWTFHDWEQFGNATTNTQVLSTRGQPIVSKLGSER